MRRWISVGLWIVAALVIIDTGISLALTCHAPGYQPGSGQDSATDCSVFQGPIFRFLIWFANAFEDHGEAVIAAFTIVLAISTIGLWRSTKKLWEAGEKQIAVAAFAANSSEQSARAAHRAAETAKDAFTKLERPYVYVFDVNRFVLSSDGIGCVQYKVANYGKTPATIELVENNVSFNSEGPIDPIVADYRDDPEHPLLKRPILGFNFEETVRINAPGNLNFIATEGREVVPKPRESDEVFVWVRISYRGPFTTGHQTSACWRYDGLTNRLVQWGDEKYNYVR
jgi:hypothetical protein